jgi:hypothetical protein
MTYNTRDLKHILLTEILNCANCGKRDIGKPLAHNIVLRIGSQNVVEIDAPSLLLTFGHSTPSQLVHLLAHICK